MVNSPHNFRMEVFRLNRRLEAGCVVRSVRFMELSSINHDTISENSIDRWTNAQPIGNFFSKFLEDVDGSMH